MNKIDNDNIKVDLTKAIKMISNKQPDRTEVTLTKNLIYRFNICLLDRYTRLSNILYQVNDITKHSKRDRQFIENGVISLIYESAKSTDTLMDNLCKVTNLIKK